MSEPKPSRGSLALWRSLTFYEKFEQSVVFVLTILIALIVLAALWNLLKLVATSLLLVDIFDPTDPAVFQTVFGAIFTVVIALEFKRSLLVVVERRFGIVQVRAVVMIAILAVVRKFIILDLSQTEAMKLLALGAAILALGIVYWLVRDQDRREAEAAALESAETRPP
ncbi:phosphate-starvation-inducible PsiE family protein [Siccirubricoccus sp. KC 17139]|uniref:Phosphate-starvation-inducible PsiE family protein n=1 Tax=Siccirubricoccus soli TaxID=2899147 RepID=A0ABT1CZY1_9PROT|nr:phosphate-starvation-inducible PsiE family protein [Siccirubricoccus soli]MCO6415197.1 phosphate-starvation-inducible PsiE family protein [Siccirubricoccus soli]MCP2681328.1 phosphate-starvation-inducible PsiE family protein [Siccirubricoccus soli]